MTKFSKTLVVFVFAACVGFMGAATVLSRGGPNWEAEAGTSDMQLYDFSISGQEGPKPVWSVRRGFGAGERAELSSSTNPAHVLRAAHKDLQQFRTQEIEALKQETAETRELTAEIIRLRSEDKLALESRQSRLTERLLALEAEVTEVSDELRTRTRESSAVRSEARKRREDVVRLQNQLELLRTEAYRLAKEEQTLTDRLIQLRLTNRSLKHRNDRLKETIGENSG